MLKGIITLLIFQFIGECISRFFSLVVPGAVIGMVLLLLFLILRKGSFKSLDTAVFLHLRYLPMLLIPAAMGIITEFETISKEIYPILISLIFGTIIALAFSAKLMDILTSKRNKQ